MFGYMNYGPYICIGAVLAILFILWVFWGGKNYEFVGLSPLDPQTIGSYTGSVYSWGQPINEIPDSITINPHSVLIDNTPSVPVQFQDNICPNDQVTVAENSEPMEIAEPPVIFNPSPNLPNLPNLPKPSNLPKIANVSYVPKQPRRGRFISKGERICCQTMERIYGVPFSTIRPNWLKNPETGENLELDCYNDELQIAVEYNGEQHYKWPNFTQQSQQQFINQVRRDELKLELCNRNGIYLIVVPYNVPHDRIPEYITSYLPETLQKRLQEERTLANLS